MPDPKSAPAHAPQRSHTIGHAYPCPGCGEPSATRSEPRLRPGERHAAENILNRRYADPDDDAAIVARAALRLAAPAPMDVAMVSRLLSDYDNFAAFREDDGRDVTIRDRHDFAVRWVARLAAIPERHPTLEDHRPGELPDCSPLLCGHPANPEPTDG